MRNFRTTVAAAAMITALAASAAQAQELSFSGGMTLTSDYMSRGVSFSLNRPALQFFGEVEASGLYGGAFVSTVRGFGDDLELTLYAGYRFELGGLGVDLGYARYLYDNSGNCCGELYALFETEVDRSTFSAGFYYDPSARVLTDAHLGVGFGLTDQFSASLTAGRASDGVVRWSYAVAGVDYAITDNFSVNAAYHFTRAPAERNRFVVSASLNF